MVVAQTRTAEDAGVARHDEGGTAPDQALSWQLIGISGVVGFAMGVLVLAYPEPSLRLLGLFLGIELLIGGILLVVRGVATGFEESEGAGAILLGTLGVIAGLLAIRNPGETLVLLVLAFAIFLIVAGALSLSAGLIHRERRGLHLLRGVALLAAGTVIIAWPKISLGTLALLVGISLIVQGGLEIAEAFVRRGERRRATEG